MVEVSPTVVGGDISSSRSQNHLNFLVTDPRSRSIGPDLYCIYALQFDSADGRHANA